MLYNMLYSRPLPPPLCLNVYLAPRQAALGMPVLKPRLLLFLPLLVLLPKQAEERDVNWEDYNYEREPAAGGGSQAENPLAALLAGIPDFNTEELEAFAARPANIG